jgi:cell shape-determining protein MreC
VVLKLIISGGKKIAENKQIKKYVDSFFDNPKAKQRAEENNRRARQKMEEQRKKREDNNKPKKDK